MSVQVVAQHHRRGAEQQRGAERELDVFLRGLRVAGSLENAQLRVVTVGKPVVSSPVVVENVAVRVSFHVRRARRRGFVRLYGTVAPAEVGALVGFQLLRPGRSVNEGGTAITAGTASVSRFSAVVRLRHRGLYRALIKVSDGAHVSNYSEPILIRGGRFRARFLMRRPIKPGI